MHGRFPKNLWSKESVDFAKSNRTALMIGVAVVLVLAYLVYSFTGSSQQARRGGRGAAEGPVPVLAASARTADVPVYLIAVGTTKPLNTVTMRPQVDGRLLSVNFQEGQDLKKGDVVARIDPVTYQAQLDQTIAKKAQDEAQLANARIDLDRYERLAATALINRQQADTQKALVAQLEALVKSDQASIDNAQALLGYTTIVSPVDGRTGIRMVDEGNFVRAADTNSAIVVITQLKPISVLFTLPQQSLDDVNKAFAQNPLTVEATRSDNDAVIDRGVLKVVDNQVDQTTGTVKLRADFPNADLQLWPGQFVNVRLLLRTLKDVTVVPTGAVQRGPNGTFVYVVKDDNTAAMRTVTITQQDESQAVIGQGVAPNERVITTGFARLTDGSKLTIDSGQSTPGAQPQGGRRGDGQGGQQRQQRGN